MRESERKTYTVVWVVVTIVAGLALATLGGLAPALVLVAVSGIGLVVFLRVTHPGGETKPPIGIFFDEPSDAATPTPPPGAAPVVDLRDAPAGDAPLATRAERDGHEPVMAGAPPAKADEAASLSANEDAALAQVRAASVEAGDRQVELLQKIRSQLAQYD